MKNVLVCEAENLIALLYISHFVKVFSNVNPLLTVVSDTLVTIFLYNYPFFCILYQTSQSLSYSFTLRFPNYINFFLISSTVENGVPWHVNLSTSVSGYYRRQIKNDCYSDVPKSFVSYRTLAFENGSFPLRLQINI